MVVTVHRILQGDWFFAESSALSLYVQPSVTHLIHVPEGSLVARTPDGQWFCALARSHETPSANQLVALAESKRVPDVYITSTIV